MDLLTDTPDEIAALDAIADLLGGLVGGLLAGSAALADLHGFDDDRLLLFAASAERVGRLADAVRVAGAGEIEDRSRLELGAGRLSARRGCRTPAELIERVTQASSATARKRMALGRQLRTRYTITGVPCPPDFPAVAAAVAEGSLGRDSAEAILSSLGPLVPRVDPGVLRTAETALVEAATGTGEDTPVPATADETRIQALTWKAVIDPDGVLPDDEAAMRERGFRLGAERGGLIPVSGGLMPEIAAKLQRLFDAFLNPKSAPVAFPSSDEQREQGDDELVGPGLVRDDRTADQQRHDVLAAVVDVAARSTEAPTIGGAAPTVLVSVRQSDLDSGTGAGHIDGMDSPISIKSVRQMICTGGTQRVTLNTEGRILGLGAEDRCFTAQQRRAIILRDGGCLIPGCPLPGSWAEIHHVTPDVEGGPTHTDNGTSC
jgi:hypothetical protein